MMAAMRHPNVVLYLGVCLDPPCVVTEYCARGSLNDVLKRALYNPKYAEQLDWRVRYGPRPFCTEARGSHESVMACFTLQDSCVSSVKVLVRGLVPLQYAAVHMVNIKLVAAG